jgi:hypothetical protein
MASRRRMPQSQQAKCVRSVLDLIAGALVGLTLLASSPAAAADPVAASPRHPFAPASAIEVAARGVVAALGEVPDGLVISSAALVSDEPAPRANELRERVLRLVAGKLGAEAASGPLEEAAAGAPGYVLLEPRIARGRLVLAADGYAMPTTVWARVRQPKPRVVRHAQAQAPLDAEVRTFLEPLGFTAKPTITTHLGADPEVLALACGDLDADGVNDVVTVTRERVLRVRLDASGVHRVAELAWVDHAAIAPVPLRQPLAFATIVEGPTPSHPRGHLDVTITDRRGSLRLDPDLAPLAKMKGKAVPHSSSTACTWTFQLQLGEKVRSCNPADAPLAVLDLKRRSDAMASMHLVAPDGRAQAWIALRDAGVLVLRNAEDERRLARVGAQLAIGDLDQDGAIEIVTTVDTLAARFDAVEVRTVAEGGKLTRRFRHRVPKGVQAVATCPPDGRGTGAVIVATNGELWTLR